MKKKLNKNKDKKKLIILEKLKIMIYKKNW